MKNNKNQKEKGLSLISKISSISELPIDTLLGYPLMQMYGNRELFIEGVTVLSNFDEERIFLKLGRLNLCIKGRKLNLKNLADENILISGYITSIEFE